MQTDLSIADELRTLLARELEVEIGLVTPEALFVGDLGASSINAIIVVMALEDRFGLRIEDDEAEGLRTLTDVQAFLESRGVGLDRP